MNQDEFDRLARQHLDYMKATGPRFSRWKFFAVIGLPITAAVLATVADLMGWLP